MLENENSKEDKTFDTPEDESSITEETGEEVSNFEDSDEDKPLQEANAPLETKISHTKKKTPWATLGILLVIILLSALIYLIWEMQRRQDEKANEPAKIVERVELKEDDSAPLINELLKRQQLLEKQNADLHKVIESFSTNIGSRLTNLLEQEIVKPDNNSNSVPTSNDNVVSKKIIEKITGWLELMSGMQKRLNNGTLEPEFILKLRQQAADDQALSQLVIQLQHVTSDGVASADDVVDGFSKMAMELSTHLRVREIENKYIRTAASWISRWISIRDVSEPEDGSADQILLEAEEFLRMGQVMPALSALQGLVTGDDIPPFYAKWEQDTMRYLAQQETITAFYDTLGEMAKDINNHVIQLEPEPAEAE